MERIKPRTVRTSDGYYLSHKAAERPHSPWPGPLAWQAPRDHRRPPAVRSQCRTAPGSETQVGPGSPHRSADAIRKLERFEGGIAYVGPGGAVIMATAPSQATDNPFGSNPFERTDPNFQLWADAERLARERWERFRANHMARMPLDSASPEEFIKFKVALTVALFDAWAGPYCAFRPWRGKEGEFNEVLFDEYIGRFADQHIEHVTKYANTRGLSHAKTVILETRIAINQRRAHWKAEGYRIAREEREVEAAATNGPTPEPTRRIEETSKNPANVPPALRKKRLTLIRSKRKDGESMESLARRFAVSKDSLYAVAKGDTRKCGPETAELILRKLNVTPEEWNAV